MSISSVSTIGFGVSVALKVFSSGLALVRGLVGLLVSVLVLILGPGLTKRPFFLLFGLKGVYGFVDWSSVSLCVSLDTDVHINRFVGLFVKFQLAKSWLHLVGKQVSKLKSAAQSRSLEVSDTSLSVLLMKTSFCGWTWISGHGQLNTGLSSLRHTKNSGSPESGEDHHFWVKSYP